MLTYFILFSIPLTNNFQFFLTPSFLFNFCRPWPPGTVLTMIKSLITKCSTYHLCIMAMLFLSCHQVMSLLLPLRTLWTVWISGSMVTHGAAPSPPIFTTAKASLLGSPCVLASWFVTSSLDPPSAMRLSGQAKPTLHSN
jgi:hypothetical protein